MNKKTLIILGLALLGCNGQMQAMSAFKQGARALLSSTRFYSQQVKPFCPHTYEQQLEENAYLDVGVKKAVFEIFEKYNIHKVKVEISPDGIYIKNKTPDGFIRFGIDTVEAPIINSYFKDKIDYSDQTANTYFKNNLFEFLATTCDSNFDSVRKALLDHKTLLDHIDVAYLARHITYPFCYPLEKKEYIKGVLLHEIGHVVHNHHEQRFTKSEKFIEQATLNNLKGLKKPLSLLQKRHDMVLAALARRQEREADAFAANELMKDSNLKSLKGLAERYKMAIYTDPMIDENVGGRLYRTHPYYSERAAFFQQKADELEKQLAEESKK